MVDDVRIAPVVTLGLDATIQEAAKLMVQNWIGAIPIMDAKKKLVGIIVESDILRAFVAGKNDRRVMAEIRILPFQSEQGVGSYKVCHIPHADIPGYP